MPARKSVQHSAAADTSWGYTANRTARTAPARAAADRRFYEQALERNPGLTGDALDKAAASLRSAYFKTLAAKSAQARRKAAS